MQIKVSIVIMSHLSDIQTDIINHAENRKKINFVKYLLLAYPNTTDLIDATIVYEHYCLKHPNLI